MKASTVWTALVLLGIGACGILDATGVAGSAGTIGQWWPVAVIGWAIAGMLGARHVTLGGVVGAAFGTALLADAQAWASDAVVWSSLAIVIGGAVLVAAIMRRGDRRELREVRALAGGDA